MMVFVNDLWRGDKPAKKCRGCDMAHFHSTGKTVGLYTFGKSEYSTAAVKASEEL